ncbi:uncharacterized protein C22orf31-like [Astyanax mexicanus]|uniref:uncharacterized protein C22orf31-like n=1 Tax=Astyanax mexicanus TaxID=7994 RepID=UPI0020CAF09B|nr:uncharacterized protein C22orf31-like [Astyanax mexicanus]
MFQDSSSLQRSSVGHYGLRRTRKPSAKLKESMEVSSAAPRRPPRSTAADTSVQEDHSYSCLSRTTGKFRILDEFQERAAVLPPFFQTFSTITPEMPDFRPPPEVPDSPLWVHGLSVEEFQGVYHSVVDPVMGSTSGKFCLQFGRELKQRLRRELRCPILTEEVQPDGRVKITEAFSSLTPVRSAPDFDLDTSGEPLPGQQPKKKRRQC